MDGDLNDFVLRPGRSLVAWYGEVKRQLTIKVAADIAVSVACDGEHGTLIGFPAAREHVFAFSPPKRVKVKLVLQNASGTRKARGTLEVSGG